MKAKWIVAIVIALGLSPAHSAKKQKAAKGDPADCVLESLAGSGIGDIKHSILSESDFQAVHGDEWVQLKGQALSSLNYGTYDTSNGTIATQMTDTSSYADATKLPDASGRFLRAVNMSGGTAGNPESTKIGGTQNHATGIPSGVTAFQTNATGNHQHFSVSSEASSDGTGNGTINETTYLSISDYSGHQAAYALDGVSNGANYGLTSVAGYHSHSIASGGDVESRPKNVTVNVYVKIRRACINEVVLQMARSSRCLPNDTDTYPNGCFVDFADPHDKVSCLKAAFDDWKDNVANKLWAGGCLMSVAAAAKQELIDLGENRTAEETTWFNTLNTQYSHYYRINSKPLPQ